MNGWNIRLLERRDNERMAGIIRACLVEFGGNRAGLAWEDASLHDLHAHYGEPGRGYWVALDGEGEIAGGCGIAAFAGSAGVCELQKMYLLPAARGTGAAGLLLAEALAFARGRYRQCYLETLTSMKAAERFYGKHGFAPLRAPLAGSEHYACDAWYIRDL
ncbi:GNAT family N-acetyltransferase [Paenibacillus albicereus]|uniref:GNAT family N-acetyltransferase n=1 Tax=Paenibacillus albicereus TaxID=2726185 RepID=A0A6H2GTK5_9BACL|nr:GNAT family N-acetyltransferase [Paenibacillus albicereus]QJC50725.1 GNAT family N-acetyltransferase [Paenibacillus albicereus]